MLRSTHFIAFKKFNHEADLVYRASIVPSKKHDGDENFKIYALVMHEHVIHRSPFVYDIEEENLEQSCDEGGPSYFDDDADDDDIPILENVVMQQDTKNFCYYVTRCKG